LHGEKIYKTRFSNHKLLVLDFNRVISRPPLTSLTALIRPRSLEDPYLADRPLMVDPISNWLNPIQVDEATGGGSEQCWHHSRNPHCLFQCCQTCPGFRFGDLVPGFFRALLLGAPLSRGYIFPRQTQKNGAFSHPGENLVFICGLFVFPLTSGYFLSARSLVFSVAQNLPITFAIPVLLMFVAPSSPFPLVGLPSISCDSRYLRPPTPAPRKSSDCSSPVRDPSILTR